MNRKQKAFKEWSIQNPTFAYFPHTKEAFYAGWNARKREQFREMYSKPFSSEIKKYKEYYDVIDEQLVISHLGVASDNAKKDINRLLAYEQSVGAYFENEKLRNENEELKRKIKAYEKVFNLLNKITGEYSST